MFEKPWRTRIPQWGQDQCLRDAFRCTNPALVSLVLETGNVSEHEAQRHITETICKLKDAKILSMLFDAGAEPEELDLRNAVKYGNEEMVDLIIKNGVTRFSQSVIEAARSGKNEALEKILKAGGKPDTRKSCSINAAAENGLADTVTILLAYGEKVTNIRPQVLEKVKQLANKPGYSNYSKTLKVLEEAGLYID